MQLNSLIGIAVVLLIVGLVMGVSAISQAELKSDIVDDYGNTSNAYKAVDNTENATVNISDKLPLYGTIAGLMLVVGLVLGFFGSKKAGMF